MKTLTRIPHELVGRGHNQCTPIECACGCLFLFGLSDGTKREHHRDEDTTLVTCPQCRTVNQFTFGQLTVFNGQSGSPFSAEVKPNGSL